MKLSVLKTKAKMNFDIGLIARKMEYFDVAISRLYYALYQLIDSEMIDKQIHTGFSQGESSIHNCIHKWLNDFFKESTKMPREDFRYLCHWNKLKSLRVRADYNDKKCLSEKEYNEFLSLFEELKNCLVKNRFLSIVPWEE